MPTYEYACKTCGNRFEEWQKITDEPLTECPKCHNEIHRVLFPAGVVFKGSGFYSTDHRGHKSGGEGASAPAAEAQTEAQTEAKSETAPGTGDKAGATGEKGETKSAAKTESKPAAAASETAKAS